MTLEIQIVPQEACFVKRNLILFWSKSILTSQKSVTNRQIVTTPLSIFQILKTGINISEL